MPSTRPLTSQQLALQCSEAALDKKAEDLVILDLRGLSSFTDFFVIASGNSEPHLKAIAQGVEEKLREKGQIRPSRVDGFPLSQWVVMDYGDVLVHLFHQTKRSVYALEDLWGDAPRLPLESDPIPQPSASRPSKSSGSGRAARPGSSRRASTPKSSPRASASATASAPPSATSKPKSASRTSSTPKSAPKKTARRAPRPPSSKPPISPNNPSE